MFDSVSEDDLEGFLNQFPVPMFAVERENLDKEFRFLCLNKALEHTGHAASYSVAGKTPFDVLPGDEAQRMHEQYVHCAETRGVTRFRDAITTRGRKVIWDTTLQYVPNDAGRDRILGTTVELCPNGRVIDPTLEDIQYVSSMADMQLENLINLFDRFRDKGLFTTENEQRVTNISSVCRTVQAAVSDIKRLVHNAQGGHSALATAERTRELRSCGTSPRGSDTLKALIGNVNDLSGGLRN